MIVFAKRWTPSRLYPVARPVYHRIVVPLHCWVVAQTDRLLRRKYDGMVLPPALLRYKVRGTPSGSEFASVGRQCAVTIRDSLMAFGVDLAACRSILDFGCGCGGTLLWLRELAPGAVINGTDIDESAIDWCRSHLSFASFGVNSAEPPLAYADGQFDLVYAISVFTHLDEGLQTSWLGELRRVVAPGGICLLTLHGPRSWPDMPAQDQASLRSKGFVFVRTDATKGLFPDWYQAAFHSRAYVEATFDRYFEIVGCIPHEMDQHQNYVVLRRRREHA
jgi:SAM-dependent methyltransferase